MPPTSPTAVAALIAEGGGGTLLLNTNVFNASGALNVTDTSVLNLHGNTLTSNGTATISNLTSNSGTLAGTGAYTIANATLSADTLYLNGANVSAASSTSTMAPF